MPDGGQREHAAQAGRRRHRRLRLHLDLAAVDQAPDGDVPSYATSGTESPLRSRPGPGLGDPASGSVTSAPFQVPASTGGTHLNFHHAYVMEWDGGELLRRWSGGRPEAGQAAPGPQSPDCRGSTDRPGTSSGSTASGFTGFGGDSRGYGSSRGGSLLARRTDVRVSFRVEGDDDVTEVGWWIDDIRLYSCADDVPGVPTSPRTRPPSRAPPSPGRSRRTPARGSRRTRSPAPTADARPCRPPRAARRSRGSVRPNPLTVSVAAVNAAGEAGPGTHEHVLPDHDHDSASTTLRHEGTHLHRDRQGHPPGHEHGRGVDAGQPATPHVGEDHLEQPEHGYDDVEGDQGVVGQALLEGDLPGRRRRASRVSLGSLRHLATW